MTHPVRALCAVSLCLLGMGVPRESSAQIPLQTEQNTVPGMGEFLVGATAQTANLQRTSRFLDVNRIDRHLQVALVVDGTDSMQQDLQSLKQNLRAFLRSLANVRRNPVPTVSVAVIVYRDTGSASGPVTALVPRFESDIDVVEEALQQLESEGGAPYFREAVDQGLHYALNQLNWRDPVQEGVSRWIIVAGDAPPYPEQTEYRLHTNQQLIDAASDKQIAIYGMALGTGLLEQTAEGERLRETAERERPDLKSFLGSLAQATGGHTVDMLDEDSVRYWMTHQLKMRPITEQDIAAHRQLRGNDGQRPRVAVLPHLPLEAMDFDSGRDEVIIATHLRQRLARLGGVDVVPADAVEHAFVHPDKPQTLPRLADSLQADYLIWGTQTTNFDYLVIESRLYLGDDGSQLTTISESVKPINEQQRLMVLNVVFRNLCEAGARQLDMLGRMAHAQALRAAWDDAEQARRLMAPLADDHRAQTAILAGLNELERSLAFTKSGQSEEVGERAQRHLDAAITYLEQALTIDTHNPYAHLLLADCYQNENPDVVLDEVDPRCRRHLELAHDRADAVLDRRDPVSLEIMAQHALLVTRDVGAAIEHYRRLASDGATDARFDLRAHWMLAGIHLGDWGAMSWGWDHVDPEQARAHVLAILAFWPESPEAGFYRDCIRNSTGDSLDVPVGTPQLARSF